MAQAPFLILERQFALDFLHSARTKKINGSGPYILFWACSRGVRVEALSLCISYCYHPSNSKVPRIATCLSQTMHPVLFFFSWPIFASLCTANYWQASWTGVPGIRALLFAVSTPHSPWEMLCHMHFQANPPILYKLESSYVLF